MAKGKNFYLDILNGLKDAPANEVADSLGLSKQSLNYHLKKLKLLDIVENIGYGTWHVKEENLDRLEKLTKKVKKTSKNSEERHKRVSPNKGDVPAESYFVDFTDGVKAKLEPDTVRSHAYHFVLQIRKNIRNWCKEKRREYLDKKKVHYEKIRQGEQLLVKGCTVWLTNKSVNVWLPHSFYVEEADDGYALAVQEFLKVVKGVESLLRLDFRINGRHKWRVASEHHALIMNALAKEYNDKKEKLFVDDAEDGVWAWIDDSEGLNEFETGLPGERGRSANRKVKYWFNGLKRLDEEVGPQDILDMIGELSNLQMFQAENIASHVPVFRSMKEGFDKWSGVLERIDRKLGGEGVVDVGGSGEVDYPLLGALKKKIETIDDVIKYGDYVEMLSRGDKVEFTDWLFDEFGNE